MSIFFDFDVGSSGRFRRAVDGDKANIQAIVDSKHTVPLFGDVNIGSLIELSTLSICMIDEKHEVTGFVAVCDHPNVPALDPSDWEIWIRNLFQKYYLSRNTLFIHFMYCIDSMTDVFLDEAFKSIFINDVYLQQLVMVVPPNCPENCIARFLSRPSQRVNRFLLKRTSNSTNEIYLHVASRDDYYLPLKIRRAVEEDNDDVVKILGKDCPRLQELYGDYYISELIGRHPEMKRTIIVAEHQNEVVGVMCLNSEVNYEMLQDTYELANYNGLQKTTPYEKEVMKRENEVLRVFGEPIMYGKWSPFSTLQKELALEKRGKTDACNGKPNDFVPAIVKRMKSKVLFQSDNDEVVIREHTMDVPDDTDNSHYNHNLSIVDVLKEDSFDYDIVNIQENLLSVPDALMYDASFREFRKEKMSKDDGKHEKKRQEYRPSEFKKLKKQQKMYSGIPDAFIIELFGLRENIDAIHAFELLQGAFEIMSDFDYCLLSLPCEAKTSNLLHHFSFVPTKAEAESKYALYVAHRNSVFSKLRVRRAELIDIPQIASFLQSIDSREVVWTVENTILKRNELKCFVFMCALTVVGIGLLEPADELHLLETSFNLAPYHIRRYHRADPIGSYAMIKSAFIYPVFEPHFRFFARDMMRLSGSTTLMFLTAYRNIWRLNKANGLVGAMVPLLPRVSEMICSPEHDKWMKMSQTIMPFSAWLLSKKITSIPQVNINTRIVIVGASRTALAFLNTLLFSDTSTYLVFNNVTLVSKQGMPYCRRQDVHAESMFNNYKTNSDRYMKSVPYTYYVNVVQGQMVKIEKREKYIQLTNGCRCYYDQLFLLFGKQYQHPHYLDDIINSEKKCTNDGRYTRMDVPRLEDPIEPCNLPRNLFLINSLVDANKAVSFIKSLELKYEDKIIVYGSTLNPYCCIATLLEMNVPGENIIFVESFPDENPRKARISVFCNVYVDTTVKEFLDKFNVQVYRSYYFKSWTVDVDNFVCDVSFTSATKMITLPCVAFFYYGRKAVNKEAFIALNKSGIVYDGGIQIDHEFRTKDPSIYAAGPVTRYHRCYFAEHKRLKYYDAFEIGTKLGEQIRNKLDPLFSVKVPNKESHVFSQERDKSLHQLPHFKSPFVRHCVLPGLKYLEVRSPGKKIPHHYVQLLDYNGFVLETFKGGYFKLHLTKDFRVDGITCLTAENRSLIEFKKIYGLPSSVLNNVFLRFMTKRIDNFYEFFESSWASFLYHEQSDELFALVKELLPKNQRQGDTLQEVLLKLLDEESCPTLDSLVTLRSRLENSLYFEAITDYVIEWVTENESFLPMYLNPHEQSNLTSDVKAKDVFKKRKRSILKMLSKII